MGEQFSHRTNLRTPAIVFAGHDNLGDLKGREVGQAQLHEFTLFVHLVDGFEGLGERNRSV